MIAVSNSSVLIALCKINQESLLIHRFSKGILIPKAVWHELVEEGHNYPDAKKIASLSWLYVHEIKDNGFFSLLSATLDRRESEAIVLAQEHQPNAVLLDEKDARKAAQHLGFNVLGTDGILLWGKQVGLISYLKDCLDYLHDEGRFRLSKSI